MERQHRHYAPVRSANGTGEEETMDDPDSERLQFDYKMIQQAHRSQVRQVAADIRSRSQRMFDDYIEIGRQLQRVQLMIGNGWFLTWVENEFDWSYRTAYRMIAAAEFVSQHPNLTSLSNLSVYALNELASHSTPEPVREEVIQRMETTHWTPTREEIKERKRQYGHPSRREPRPEGTPASNEKAGVYNLEEESPSTPPLAVALQSLPLDNLTLVDYLLFLQTAKTLILALRSEHKEFVNAVNNALPAWSQLLTQIERRLKT